MIDYNTIRSYDLNSITSEHLQFIILHQDLRLSLEALLLLNETDIIKSSFKLSDTDIQEYTNNIFKVNKLVSLGKIFILSYLKETKQYILLDYVYKGTTYILARMGQIDILSPKQEKDIIAKIRNQTELEALDTDDYNLKIKTVTSFSKYLEEKDDDQPLDKIIKMFKEKGYEI